MRLKSLVVGTIASCFLLIFLLVLTDLGFKASWRRVKAGMNEAMVRQRLGPPNQIQKTGVLGAGDKYVTRWAYERSHYIYCVDFDYIGPDGAPLVYRTEILEPRGSK